MQKSRVVYFTPGSKYYPKVVENNHEPVLRRLHRWLEHEFDLICIEEDCDLRQIVQKYNPYALLFDGILEGCFDLKLEIKNIDAYPDLPRAGLVRTDSLSPATTISIRILQSYGVDGFFTMGDSSTWEAVPSIKDNLYFIPWFIDDEIFKDYKEEKTIPVVMFGSFDSECYPWRRSVKQRILDNLPALYFRHPGYNKEVEMKQSPLQYAGERYARMLNRAWIAPSSGGFNNFVVSKQIEIPACRTILVTNETEVVQAYGFEDWKNCIFTTEDDIVATCKRVLNEPFLLNQIADQGYDFVRANHTYRNRAQVSQWFELKKDKLDGYKIVQPDIMKPLELERTQSSVTNKHFKVNPAYTYIEKSDIALNNGALLQAESYAIKARNFCGYMSEPSFRLSLIYLLEGRLIEAIKISNDILGFDCCMHSAVPDPNNYALILLCCACARDSEQLTKYFTSHWEVRSPLLDFVRLQVANVLGDGTLTEKVLTEIKKPTPMTLSSINLEAFTMKDFEKFVTTIFKIYKLVGPQQVVPTSAATTFIQDILRH